MAEITTPLLIQLDEAEREALRRFVRRENGKYSEAQAARILLRDALIGIGDLPLRNGKGG